MLKCLRASHITEFQNISSVSHFRIMYWEKFLELHKNLIHLIYGKTCNIFHIYLLIILHIFQRKKAFSILN